jgi:hypothetical protein
MSFYISIFNKKLSNKYWLKLVLVSSIVLSLLIFGINFFVDPYNVTNYNVLNIKHKFARDDRIEKVNFFKTLPKFDNILLGSSRVYSMNPLTVSSILGGTTYNFGVGGGSVEDQLGTLLYLKREKKLPKNLIIGVDFYTFNPKVPPNKYFLKNKELNFLTYDNYKSSYIEMFFSIDALRASLKTLKHHIKKTSLQPRFDKNGWTGGYEDYSKRNLEKDMQEVNIEIEENKKLYYTNF